MANHICVEGNIVNEPVVRKIGTTNDGRDRVVLNFRLADNSGFGDKQKTNFWDVSVFGPKASYGSKFLKKGAYVNIVSGELRQESFTDKNGAKRTAVKIVVNGPDSIQFPRTGSGSGAPTAPVNTGNTAYVEPGGPLDIDEDFSLLAEDDDVPF